MAKQVVETMIEGGKASAAPPLGPALGPTGLNIGQVITEINKKTADLKGMQVPVKVIIDTTSKTFTIEVGTPPTAALIKKEAGIKVAKMKEDALLGKGLKNKMKEVIGTCQSMGILVEGMSAQDALKAMEEGVFDEEIASGRTELTAEQKAQVEEEKHRLKEEMETRKAEFQARAKAIVAEMTGQENRKIRAKMMEVGIPKAIMDELAPEEKKEAAPGAAKKK